MSDAAAGKRHFETEALHAGQRTGDGRSDRAVPVARTTAYTFSSAEHAVRLFSLEEPGFIYTRLNNPTQAVLEERLAALEGGAGALAVASGTSAIFYAIINIARAGDEIVSGANLYGGTHTMFSSILPQFGITVRIVDQNNVDAIAGAINDKTRAVYIESIGNPSLTVPDFEAIAAVAHERKLPLIVDGTFTTPYLFRGLDHGCDIVVHSLTKWMGGHGTAIAGGVVDSGRFPWDRGPFPLLNEPDDSYHGLRFSHDLGAMNPLAYILRMRLVPLRNLGAAISPDNAWMILQGIETLPLRMQRHCENAMAVAEFLSKHPRVAWVRYPGLADDPNHENARRYFNGGFGGMVVFGVKGGADAGKRFIERLRLFSHVANVGDAKSLAIHPAGTTHSQLSEQDQRAAGIAPELVRLSIGIEHIDDILRDLDVALNS